MKIIQPTEAEVVFEPGDVARNNKFLFIRTDEKWFRFSLATGAVNESILQDSDFKRVVDNPTWYPAWQFLTLEEL